MDLPTLVLMTPTSPTRLILASILIVMVHTQPVLELDQLKEQLDHILPTSSTKLTHVSTVIWMVAALLEETTQQPINCIRCMSVF
jgi:hypothetical protein